MTRPSTNRGVSRPWFDEGDGPCGGGRKIDENKADGKVIVTTAPSREATGSWLLVVDNADDVQLLLGESGLSGYLLSGPKGRSCSRHGTTRSR